MRKKWLMFIMFVLFLIPSLLIPVDAAEIVEQGDCGENVSWTLWNDGTLELQGNGAMYDYVNYADAPQWWEIRNQIYRVEIAHGITTIGNFMFAYSENLQEVSIPETVTSIGEYAFRDCISLEKVTLPNSVTHVLSCAFYGCDALVEINLPDTVSFIGELAFAYSDLLPHITLPAGLEELGTGVFRGCISLQNIYISSANSLYSSVDGVLYNKGITKILCFPSGRGENGFTIPNSVKIIGNSAFYDCESLTALIIPEGVTTIEAEAFYRCHKLGSIQLPRSLRSIGSYAFYACWSLIEVGIPYGLEKIQNGAFYDCANLHRIVIPDSVTFMGDFAFYACTDLKSIILPNNLLYLGDFAFCRCESLENIYFPGKIASYGSYVLADCTSLSEVFHSSEDNLGIHIMMNGIIHNVPSMRVIKITHVKGSGACGTLLTWVLDEDDVLTISGSGEMDNFSPERRAPWYSEKEPRFFSLIRVSTAMTSFGDYAFADTAIDSVSTGTGIRRIGDHAFTDCHSLKTVRIDNALTEIGKGAFRGCKSLESFEVSSVNLFFAAPEGVLMDRAMNLLMCYPANKPESEYIVPEGIHQIGEYAFSGCRALERIQMSDTVSEIGRGAFSGCKRLSEVTLPENLSVISPELFKDCSALKGITIPAKADSVGEYAFYNCESLSMISVSSNNSSFTTSDGVLYSHGMDVLICYPAGKEDDVFILPTSVRSMARGACGANGNLKQISIPEGVQVIPEHAFSDCKALEHVDLPQRLKHICQAAFDGCAMLKTVDYSGTEEMWNLLQIDAGNACLTDADISFLAIPDLTSKIDLYSYVFPNTREAFGYPNPYFIPFSSYEVIFGNTTRAQNLYAQRRRTAWSGSCAGMAATSALMAVNGSGVNIPMFNSSAEKPSELTIMDYSSELGLNLTVFIEALHVTQYSNAFSTVRNENRVMTVDILAGRNNLDDFHDELKEQTESGYPAILALSSGSGIGHAILAYGVEDGTDGTSRVLVYDNNYPMEERYLILDQDDSGHYTGWSYEIGGAYGVWGTTQSRSNISFIDYDTIQYIWDRRGNLAENDNLVSFNSSNIEVYSAEYELLATVVDGSLTTTTADISLMDQEISLQETDPIYILRLPIDTYIIENNDELIDNFSISMVDSELGLSVDTTADLVILSVDDARGINTVYVDAGEDDTVDVVLQSAGLSNFDRVSITGTGTRMDSLLAVSMMGAGLDYSHMDNINISVDEESGTLLSITAKAGEGGKIVPSGTVKVFQGESLEFFVTPDPGYCISDVLIDGVSVGPVESYLMENISGDRIIEAVFEALEPENLLGDLNEDGRVDETDITILASHLARIVLIDEELLRSNADVTHDGIVDSYDLTKLVSYIRGVIDTLE